MLDRFKQAPVPPGYPAWTRSFYAPVDDVHGALKYLLNSARHSLVVCMYGFTDPELAHIVRRKIASKTVFVQMSLDRSQAKGKTERLLLAANNYPATDVVIGNSERGAIMHEKVAIIDGSISITGSTNWSLSGETRQDNQAMVIADPHVAAELRARADKIHAHMRATNG